MGVNDGPFVLGIVMSARLPHVDDDHRLKM